MAQLNVVAQKILQKSVNINNRKYRTTLQNLKAEQQMKIDIC